jgi:hypothetical protein
MVGRSAEAEGTSRPEWRAPVQRPPSVQSATPSHPMTRLAIRPDVGAVRTSLGHLARSWSGQG